MLGPVLPLSKIFPYQIDPLKEQYIILKSEDGIQYHVSRRAAIQSPFLKLSQKQLFEVPFDNQICKIVIKYLYYKLRWSVQKTGSQNPLEIAPFPDMPEEIALKVAEAASYFKLE